MITVLDKKKTEIEEIDNIIYLSFLLSDGKTGINWINHFEKNNYYLCNYSRSILSSSEFNASYGMNYNLAILRANSLNSEVVTIANVLKKAEANNFLKANLEMACLTFNALSNEVMEKYNLQNVLILHPLVRDFEGSPSILSMDNNNGKKTIRTYPSKISDIWGKNYNFVLSNNS